MNDLIIYVLHTRTTYWLPKYRVAMLNGTFCRVLLLGVSADDCGICPAGFVCFPGDPIPEQCYRGYYCPLVWYRCASWSLSRMNAVSRSPDDVLVQRAPTQHVCIHNNACSIERCTDTGIICRHARPSLLVLLCVMIAKPHNGLPHLIPRWALM